MRIAAVEAIERPTEEQEIHRAPVAKPQLVKVAGHAAGLEYMRIAASASMNCAAYLLA
jgi:hypothetical protein